jgi:hypothetical protein
VADSPHDIAAAMLANALIRTTGSRKLATGRAAKGIAKQTNAEGKMVWRKVHDLLGSGRDIPAHYRCHVPEIPSRHAVQYVRVNAYATGGAVKAGDDDEKISKKESRYRIGTELRHCEICSMWRHSEHDNKGSDGECTLVEGRISPQGLCDYFRRKKESGGSVDNIAQREGARK